MLLAVSAHCKVACARLMRERGGGERGGGGGRVWRGLGGRAKAGKRSDIGASTVGGKSL